MWPSSNRGDKENPDTDADANAQDINTPMPMPVDSPDVYIPNADTRGADASRDPRCDT